jgi:hypothetical protein
MFLHEVFAIAENEKHDIINLSKKASACPGSDLIKKIEMPKTTRAVNMEYN